MKTVLIFLVLAALVSGGIYYFADGRDMSVVAGYRSLSSLKAATSTPGQVLGISTSESVSAFNSLKDMVTNPGQVIQDISTNIKEGILDQVASVLGIASSSREKEEEGFEDKEPAKVTNVTVMSGDLQVCSAHAKNEAVSYLLESVSSTAGLAYSVDWGDGSPARQYSATSSKSVLVSYAYGKSGNYTIKFMVAGSVAGLVADSAKTIDERKVCIQ